MVLECSAPFMLVHSACPNSLMFYVKLDKVSGVYWKTEVFVF